MIMREILFCATAFFLTIAIGHSPAFDVQPVIEIDHKAFRLMDCEPMFDMEGNEVKAAAECVFGGYYPLGPTTDL